MVTIKNPLSGGGGGGGSIDVSNATLTQMMSASEEIAPLTFVQIANDLVSTATTEIDGLTKTQCTPETAGDVYVFEEGA